MNPGPDWSVAPKAWGARVDYDSWNDHFTPDDGIAIHHGGGGDYAAHKEPYTQSKEKAQLRSWESYHLSRGWRGLAYGWAVGMSGTVYRIRGWNRYGAHLGDVDGDGIANNDEVIPVLFINSGLFVFPSPQMVASFERLRNYLEAESGHGLRLYGHKEIQTEGTSCPGPKNMTYVQNHRDSDSGGGGGGGYPMILWPDLLDEGDRDPAVVVLKAILAGLGVRDRLGNDFYGAGMAAEVRDFQASRGLTTDGIVGPATRAALNAALNLEG